MTFQPGFGPTLAFTLTHSCPHPWYSYLPTNFGWNMVLGSSASLLLLGSKDLEHILWAITLHYGDNLTFLWIFFQHRGGIYHHFYLPDQTTGWKGSFIREDMGAFQKTKGNVVYGKSVWFTESRTGDLVLTPCEVRWSNQGKWWSLGVPYVDPCGIEAIGLSGFRLASILLPDTPTKRLSMGYKRPRLDFSIRSRPKTSFQTIWASWVLSVEPKFGTHTGRAWSRKPLSSAWAECSKVVPTEFQLKVNSD